jgi:hypothetical protein
MAHPYCSAYSRSIIKLPRSRLRRPSAADTYESEEDKMDLLITLAAILLILWLLGLVTSFTLGGFVHILLVLALVVVLIRIIQGRRPVI